MPRRPSLPTLPTTIESYLGPVEVRLVESVLNGSCLGRFISEKRLIEIAVHQDPVQLWHTFFHEQLHLIMWDTGGQLSRKAEEHVADVYATWRVREMLQKLTPH